jgi:hypothetical protein
MDSTGYYRDLAARCVLMAEEITEPGHRASLLEMAQRWRDLAEQVEKAEINPASQQ